MKKTSIIVAFALAALSLVSCEKETRDSHRDIAPYPTPSETSWEADLAAGYFRGRGATTSGTLLNYDVYNFALLTSGVEMNDAGFAGVGVGVLLDMNTPTNGGDPMRLMSGNYSPYSNGMSVVDYCFYPGTNENDVVYPSYLYYRESETKEGLYYPITGGWMSIVNSGAGYTVNASFTTVIGSFPISYTGPIDFYDNSSSDSGDSGDDSGDSSDPSTYTTVDLSGLNQGYAYYYGQAWNVSTDDYADWVLYISDKAITDFNSDSYLQLDILTSKSDITSVTDGTYNCISDVTDDTAKPFSMVAGYTDDEGYCYGTWYFGETDSEFYAPTSGSAKISSKDEDYTVDLQFEDSYSEVKVSSIINAHLTYVDGTKEDESTTSSLSSARTNAAFQMHRFARKMLCPRVAPSISKANSSSEIPAFIKNQSASRKR